MCYRRGLTKSECNPNFASHVLAQTCIKGDPFTRNFDSISALLLRLFSYYPSLLNMSLSDGIPSLAPGHSVERQDMALSVRRTNLVHGQPPGPPPTCSLPATPLLQPQHSYDYLSRRRNMSATSHSTLRFNGPHDRHPTAIPSSPSYTSLARTICIQPSSDSLLHAAMCDTEARMFVYLKFPDR